METFKSIMVDVDATAAAHPALEQAVELARGSGARLTIVDVITSDRHEHAGLSSGAEEALVAQRRLSLTRLAQSVGGVAVEPRLLAGRPATALIQEVIRCGHDVIVRSRAHDIAASGPNPFGAVGLELLRKCPCAVLLVRPGRADAHRLIAGAVDAGATDPAEQALNTKIIELTLQVAGLEGGVPLLLHAWAPRSESTIRSHASGDAFQVYLEDMRKRAGEALDRVMASFGDRMSGVQKVLRRGRAEDVIPSFAASEGIDLVVMGTLARSGLANLLIGNLAERVFAKLPCSLLAVKPDGFVSPVRLEEI